MEKEESIFEESTNIPEITLNMQTKCIHIECVHIKNRFQYKVGTPEFGMSDSARKTYKLLNPFKYLIWKLNMKWNWNKSK